LPQVRRLTTLLFCICALLFSATESIPPAHISQVLSALPLQFEQNIGQTDPSVKFLSRGHGYSIFLTSTGSVMVLAPHGEPRRGQSVVRFQLVGANSSPVIDGMDKLAATANYFLGKDPANWHSSVSTYSRVRYGQVYPGIDLIYYGNQGRMEHDFVLAPGADPAKINLQIDGARRVRIDANGDLVLELPAGEIRHQSPVVYQSVKGQRRVVDGRFVLRGNNHVAFALGQYDRSLPLTIDPVLTYATFVGDSGSGSDAAASVAVDGSGNAYVVGTSGSLNFPVNPGPLTPGSGLSGDVFVAKFNAGATALLYSTVIGSKGSDGHGIAVDAGGNAYITGTANPGFPTTGGVIQPTSPCGGAFAVKLDPAGSVLYSTYIGAPDCSHTEGQAVAVDASGNPIFTGSTDSSAFPTTAGAVRRTNGGSGDVFVTKLNTFGTTILYSTFVGGNQPDFAYSITADPGGNFYVAGNTASTDFPVTHGAYKTTLPASPSIVAFVTKFNSAGALVYSTFLGTGVQGFSGVDSIASDSAGNAYVCGTTTDPGFPVTPGALSKPFERDEIFVTKLNPAGSALVFSAVTGGSLEDNCHAITTDGGGNVFIGGLTYSKDLPVTAGAGQPTPGFFSDGFVMGINATGTARIYSTYLGGEDQEAVRGIAFGGSGTVFVVGGTDSVTFPVTPGVLQTNHHGREDVFLTKINSTGGFIYSTFLGGSGNEFGGGVFVDGSGNLYVTGTTITGAFPGATVQGPAGGLYDVFVAKLNSTGSAFVYTAFVGGSDTDNGYGIGADSAGNAYITGQTCSSDFPIAGTIQPTSGGGCDAFAAKLNAAGTGLVYSTYLGGTGTDGARGIAVDAVGSAYIVGSTDSADFPATLSAYQVTPKGGGDIFVAKVNATGTGFSYATLLGSSGADAGYGIDIDSSGNAYVTGEAGAGNYPTTAGVVHTASAGATDCVVSKLNPSGNGLLYSTFLGGSNADSCRGVAVDASGNAYVTGLTFSSNFPLTKSFGIGGNHSSGDTFVTKLNGTATAAVYSAGLASSGLDTPSGIAVDSAGNANVVGSTDAIDFPVTANAVQASLNGGAFASAVIFKLNAAGSALTFSTYLVGSGHGVGDAITVDSAGAAYVAGESRPLNFPTTGGTVGQLPEGNGSDVFIAKISDSPGCTFSVNPASVTLPYWDSSTQVNVTGPVGCNWSTASDQQWTSIGPLSSSGSGAVTVRAYFNARPNTYSTPASVPRTAVATIASHKFIITQLGSIDTQPENVVIYNSSTGAAYNGTGNGSGTFTYTGTTWSPNFNVLRIGDWEGLGVGGLILYNRTNGAAYIRYGTGPFTPLSWGPGYDVVETGDFNGDGRSDVLLYNQTNGTAYTLLSRDPGPNNSNRGFTYNYQLWSTGLTHVRLGDFNGDGLTDVVLYNRANGNAYMGRSNWGGGFTFSPLAFGPGYDFVEVGDLNADFRSDLILYNSATGTMYAGLNNGSGGFQYVYNLVSKSFTHLRLADVDGDSSAEVLLYNKINAATYLGKTTTPGKFAFTGLVWSPNFDVVQPQDLNQDGKMDLILYNSTSGSEYSALSQGFASFNYVHNSWGSGRTIAR
jgi:hypothetical protein